MTERLPQWLLRLEGAAVAAAAVALYVEADFGWVLFGALILAPDISFLGYLGGPRVGAVVYNTAHTYVLPIALGVSGVLSETDPATQIALVWLAHIGVDRLLGYGLKYPTAFRDTHLQRV